VGIHQCSWQLFWGFISGTAAKVPTVLTDMWTTRCLSLLTCGLRGVCPYWHMGYAESVLTDMWTTRTLSLLTCGLRGVWPYWHMDYAESVLTDMWTTRSLPLLTYGLRGVCPYWHVDYAESVLAIIWTTRSLSLLTYGLRGVCLYWRGLRGVCPYWHVNYAGPVLTDMWTTRSLSLLTCGLHGVCHSVRANVWIMWKRVITSFQIPPQPNSVTRVNSIISAWKQAKIPDTSQFWCLFHFETNLISLFSYIIIVIIFVKRNLNIWLF
jgi:hypothetical protein